MRQASFAYNQQLLAKLQRMVFSLWPFPFEPVPFSRVPFESVVFSLLSCMHIIYACQDFKIIIVFNRFRSYIEFFLIIYNIRLQKMFCYFKIIETLALNGAFLTGSV